MIDEINLDYFANKLSCWIDPLVLYKSALNIESLSDNSIPSASLIFFSNRLSSMNDGGFFELVNDFLTHFRIPSEMFELLSSAFPDLSYSVINRLRDYRFNGSISEPSQELIQDLNIPEGNNPLLLVIEKDFFIDILQQPIYSLLSFIEDFSSTWMNLSKSRLTQNQIFLQHSSPEPFAVWMDAKIANYYGFTDVAEPNNNAINHAVLNNGYRKTTLVHWECIEPVDITVAREVEKSRALETSEPIKYHF